MPKKKTVVKKKAPPKKVWKALDPSQIRKSTSTIVKRSSPKRKVAPTKSVDIAKNLRQEFKKIEFDNAYEASESVLNYYDKVSQYLYSRWQQPSRTAANGTPVVQVSVSVDRRGKILSASVIKKSGIVAMDYSVKQLLSTLSSLPAPPEGPMKFNIYLELTD